MMIWETNGRFFQRDENGTKRISADLYKELSAEKPSEPSEPSSTPEKISEEIYDALDNMGAASVPDNNYSLSEIKALAQRLNDLLGVQC